MQTITKNEMRAILIIFKDIDGHYNANNLSKKIGLSSMGTLKILKRLEVQNILKSTMFGKAVFYKVNLDNDYARNYMEFLLKKEAEDAAPRIKRWVRELRNVRDAKIGILFGSVLTEEKFNDVDLLVVLEQSQNRGFNKSIGEINKINIKRIHAVKQTKEDLKLNLGKKDEVVFSIIKNGIVLFGYDEIVEVIKDVAYYSQGTN